MYKVLDEKFNEKSGLLEKIILRVGHKNADGEEYFEQEPEVSIDKEYYINGQCVYSEELYSYTKHETQNNNSTTKKVVLINGNWCGGFLSPIAKLCYLQIKEKANIYAYIRNRNYFDFPQPARLLSIDELRQMSNGVGLIFFTKTYYGENIEDSRNCDSIKLIDHEISREDPILIHVIEQLGDKSTMSTKAHIVEIPIDVSYYIVTEECDDGYLESIHEIHRTWK